MTGSLVAQLPLASPSPVRPVAPSYSVDSFSEFSTRTVNHASCPPSATSGPRSARAKEEDEEIFRDLFAGENEATADDRAPIGYKALFFIPQKPGAQRTPSSTGNSNLRQHLVPVKLAPAQLGLAPPFIPRLKLEELVNARPDDDDDDDNNDSRRTSLRGSELEQVTDDMPNGDNTVSTAAQVLPWDHKLCSSLEFTSSNQRSNNNDKREHETLRFLEKLDLNAVLHTPRPDIPSFYPGLAMVSTLTFRESKAPACSAKPTENYSILENERICEAKQRNDVVLKEPVKASRVDRVISRLAHMKSTYGTAPIVRKARRETINRLANPISGHSSTLQALSPKQREKREAALTNRAPLSPISAAIAVSCRRSASTKKVKTPGTLLDGIDQRIGDCEIPVPTQATAKRKIVKQQDPLLHKRRTITNPSVGVHGSMTNGFTKRKSKTAQGSRSLDARKEALKKKFQSGSDRTKCDGIRKIGGSTFLTQRDDEEGVELIEDFIARNRGAAQASLTFRSGTKRHTAPNLPTRNSATGRSRPRPPQTHVGVTARKNSYRGRSSQTSRGLGSLCISTDRKIEKPRAPVNSTREPAKLFQQPRRPQTWQAGSTIDLNGSSTRSLTGRSTTSSGVTNPRRLKVQPPTQKLLPRATKDPPSAATTLLMGSSVLESSTNDVKCARRGSKKVLMRKSTRSSRGTTTLFEKQLEQPKRSSTTGRLNKEKKPPVPRQPRAGRRSTSRL
ncbi:hypothetical protein F444_17500 [Phytophthora nicotianae P1976]|uniref:Uncharacterized protein n=1 Tax=Phytophthora nicotianae P1976 TaxID=1317066 RepID=A0A080ZET4_PHYNI|nr:hypothetical protein F444_17500 [Phytophthora nicotianae P1976]